MLPIKMIWNIWENMLYCETICFTWTAMECSQMVVILVETTDFKSLESPCPCFEAFQNVLNKVFLLSIGNKHPMVLFLQYIQPYDYEFNELMDKLAKIMHFFLTHSITDCRRGWWFTRRVWEMEESRPQLWQEVRHHWVPLLSTSWVQPCYCAEYG